MGYRYIGSKARIADEIIEYVKETATMESGGFFVDAFSGTGVVAEKAAQIGWPVHVNDMMTNAVIMSEARLLSSVDVPFDCLGGYEEVIKVLNGLSGEEFYTDFRLAKFIADDCRDKISIESAVADFAAGTGILVIQHPDASYFSRF